MNNEAHYEALVVDMEQLGLYYASAKSPLIRLLIDAELYKVNRMLDAIENNPKNNLAECRLLGNLGYN